MNAAAEAPLCLPPLPLPDVPRARLPAGTCDTHFHVFRPGAPLTSPRSYTPQTIGLSAWTDLAERFGIARGVLVQPSVHGYDNSVLLEALAAEPDRLRGVIVLPGGVDDAELERLDALGVRGVRVNTRNLGGLPLDSVPGLAARLADLGWILQLQVRAEQLPEVAMIAPALPCDLVVDHMGFLPLGRPEAEPGLAALQRLLDGGRAYAKISGPYRLETGARHPEFGALVRRLAVSHPERLVWGSDWPHTELWDGMPADDDLVAEALAWLPDPAVRQAVFVDTPAALFFSR